MQVDDGERAIAESIAMQELRHPFVVALHYTFQGANKTRQTQFWSNATPTTDVCTHAQTTDVQNIYFVLEYVSRGDLYDHLSKRKFPEPWCVMYTAEIALALEHCHRHNFIYRDLKVS